MFIKIFFAVAIICYSLNSNAQATKPTPKCTGECCKKQPDKYTSEVKSSKAMETIARKKDIACKLTNPEMQKRKQEVLAILKEKVLDKSELENGYKYKFEGSDKVFDELVTFIKSERACCDFFTFDISISGNKSNIWLSITGPDGAKDFIKTAMVL